MMKDMCTYLIQLRGQVNEGDLNILCPVRMTVTQVEADRSLFSLCTDQSGLVGLMRHLHGLGFVFLSVTRVDEAGTGK
jgi:hypothetical protein